MWHNTFIFRRQASYPDFYLFTLIYEINPDIFSAIISILICPFKNASSNQLLWFHNPSR